MTLPSPVSLSASVSVSVSHHLPSKNPFLLHWTGPAWLSTAHSSVNVDPWTICTVDCGFVRNDCCNCCCWQVTLVTPIDTITSVIMYQLFTLVNGACERERRRSLLPQCLHDDTLRPVVCLIDGVCVIVSVIAPSVSLKSLPRGRSTRDCCFILSIDVWSIHWCIVNDCRMNNLHRLLWKNVDSLY